VFDFSTSGKRQKAKGPEAAESRQPKVSMRRQQYSEAVAVHHFTSATPFNKTVQKCEYLKNSSKAE
jgi:hypothetical protein